MERRLSEIAGTHGGARSRKEFLSLFLAALRRGRCVADLRALGPSGAVKFAADLSVAMTAAGRTWSRSIISQSRKVCPVLVEFIRCCKAKSCNNFGVENAKGVSRSNLLRMRKNLCNMMKKRSKSSGVRRLNASCKRSMRRMLRAVLRTEEKKKEQSEIGDVNSRVEVLKSLVPGGETMDAPLLLEEAFHYIEGLQTQVESMRALLHYFGGGFHPTSL